MTRYPKGEVAEASAALFEELEPGDMLHTVLRHVSRSGMQREIDVLKLVCGDRGADTWWLSWRVSRLLGERLGKHDGVVVDGAGMDMGFELVYRIGRHLWPDGFTCIGEGCPANDHSNPGREDIEPGVTVHKDGGYALRQRWL